MLGYPVTREPQRLSVRYQVRGFLEGVGDGVALRYVNKIVKRKLDHK